MSKENFVIDFEDMGFSFADDIVEENEKTKQSTKETQERLDKLFSTVNAFLDNMAKNPDQKTLVWPNRAEKIAEFKQMLLKIKEGEI